MLPVPEQAGSTCSASEQKCQNRLVRFHLVAAAAGEDEVVAPVVGGLSPPWGHVIERHRIWLALALAVGAHRAVTLEQPAPGFRVGIAGRRHRRLLRTRHAGRSASRPPRTTGGTHQVRAKCGVGSITRKLTCRPPALPCPAFRMVQRCRPSGHFLFLASDTLEAITR